MVELWADYETGDTVEYDGSSSLAKGVYKIKKTKNRLYFYHKSATTFPGVGLGSVTTPKKVRRLSHLANEDDEDTNEGVRTITKRVGEINLNQQRTLPKKTIIVAEEEDEESDDEDELSSEHDSDDPTDDDDDLYVENEQFPFDEHYVRTWTEQKLSLCGRETLCSMHKEFLGSDGLEMDREDRIQSLLCYKECAVDEPYPPDWTMIPPQSFDFEKYRKLHPRQIPLRIPPKEYDFFFSHNWGDESLNHENVLIIGNFLTELGFSCWIDSEYCLTVKEDIRDQMEKGIKKCKTFVVFLTKEYTDKIKGGKKNDNCLFEYNIAKKDKDRINNILFIVMDNNMTISTDCQQIFDDYPGRKYIDMRPTNDDEDMQKKWITLSKEVTVYLKLL